MTETTQSAAATVTATKKKGSNVAVNFSTNPTTGDRYMLMKIKASGRLHEINLSQLMADFPGVAMSIFEMGAKTVAANCVNTTIAATKNPDDGEEALLNRLDAWQHGRYTAGTRSVGMPLFVLAFERALTNLGRNPDEIASRVQKVLSEYRLEGDALPPELLALRAKIESFDEDDEDSAKEALKLLRKHQAAIRNRFIGKDGNPQVIAAFNDITAERAKPSAPVDIDLL